MIPRWLVLSAVWGLAVILFALVAREFPVLAVFVALVCGLAGLAHLVNRRRSLSPLDAEDERGKVDRFLRDLPPGPSG